MAKPPSPTKTDRLVRRFFLGFVRTHILFHAAERPVCGVDLSEELARHGYRLGPGTLYPILHDLMAAGYLHCILEVRNGRRCKCYSVTSRGRWALVRVRKQIKELVREVMEGDQTE
ncbi:MAG: PadR family transcriptional regulator [Candidatus Methylomirabilis sp.]